MDQVPDFKPNLYPIMYWALAYGAVAGVALFLFYLLSQYITLFWFPVFLAGVLWGGYKNYQKQKQAWMVGAGVSAVPQTPMQEFRQAVGDIAGASQDLMAEQQAERQAEELAAITAQEQELLQQDPQGQFAQDEDLVSNPEQDNNYPPQNQPPRV